MNATVCRQQCIGTCVQMIDNRERERKVNLIFNIEQRHVLTS